MSKNSIEWHEDVLKIQKDNLARMGKEIERLQVNHLELLTEVLFHELQIKEAKKFGKDGFDRERFMKTHKKKT